MKHRLVLIAVGEPVVKKPRRLQVRLRIGGGLSSISGRVRRGR